MPRLALLACSTLALTLPVGVAWAQYAPYYPPPYQADRDYPRQAAPYPYAPPPPDYRDRPYPRTWRPRYREAPPYRTYPARPTASYPRRQDEVSAAPADAQPRYSYSQPPPAAYAQPQYPTYAQRPEPPSAQSDPVVEPAAGPSPAASDQPQGQLLTPAQEGRRSVVTAAEAPLHDLNLVRQTIPDILMTAMADPYAAPSPATCEELAVEIENLSQVLGPDYDADQPERKKGITESGGLGLSLMHNAAASVLPFHGYVSTLSGAAKHDELVVKALNGGAARRAYLKGLGEARGCPSPASPTHLTQPPIVLSDDSRKPYYPIR